MKKLYLLTLILYIISANTFAQSKNASVKDLAFMAGTWAQKHPWGDMEEFWGPPMGDNMICSFRCIKNGNPIFYEFIVIEPVNGTPVMKIRHFNKGSIAWEEKDKPYLLPLIRWQKNEAEFEATDKQVRIVYKRLSPVKLDSYLYEKDKAGKWKKDEFNYVLKK
jgi:hypothetical protein